VLALAVSLILACGNDKPKDVAVPPTVTRTGMPTAESKPSGVASVDAVIAIVASRDQAAWARAIKLTPVNCTTALAPGQPSCQAGEGTTTPVPVLKRTTDAACNTATTVDFLRAGQMAGLLDGLGSQQLYAVYILHSPGGSPRYGVLYAVSGGGAVKGTSLQVEDGQVIGIDVYCRASLDDLLIDVSPQDVVLPPQFR
jgi:hypothetical protein